MKSMDIHQWSALMDTPEGRAKLDAARKEYAAQRGRPVESVVWREKRTRRGAGGRRMWLYLKSR
jgi:hypothetical protein